MATTFEDLKRFMDESGLKYDTHEEHDVIGIGFGCEPKETTYRDADGDAHVQVIVRLAEQGELVAVFAPVHGTSPTATTGRRSARPPRGCRPR